MPAQPETPRDSLTVPDHLRGVRLQDYLARSYPGVHRTALRRLVSSGAVRVNGLPAGRDRRLAAADLVEVRRRGDLRVRRQPAPEGLPVLHENAAALVLDKPAGLPTVPARGGGDSVHGRLCALRPEDDLRIVHRLDRDTSGCLIVARGLEAARHFDAALRARRVHKEYVALVAGELAEERQVVELFLGPDPRRPGKVLAAAEPRRGFRAARTEVRVAQRWRGYTLLELLPATGRGHQLRVHLRALGHPIVGDADYGGEPLLLSRLKPGYKLRRGVAERPLLQRPFLHAAAVRCECPDGTAIAARAPLPADLQLVLDKLARFCARN